MQKIFNKILRIMPVLFWIALAVVTVFMLITLSPPKIKLSYIDKVEHAFVFIILTSMGLIAWPQRKRIIFVGLTIFGAATELAQQAFTAYRQATVGDWAADVAGILIALAIFYYLKKCRIRGKQTSEA